MKAKQFYAIGVISWILAVCLFTGACPISLYALAPPSLVKPDSAALIKTKWRKTGFWTASKAESLARQKAMPVSYSRDNINKQLRAGTLILNETNTIVINGRKYLLLKDFHEHQEDVKASYLAYHYNRGRVFGDPVVVKTISKTRVPLWTTGRPRTLIDHYDAAVQWKEREKQSADLKWELDTFHKWEDFFPGYGQQRYVKDILDYRIYDPNSRSDSNIFTTSVMPY